MPGPYAGLRILDLTQGLAGPLACALFADLGAEVIKVEPPSGDRMAGHPGYHAWNRGKLRLVLDAGLDGSPGADQATVHSLIGAADAVVFDTHPGVLERLGLDAPRLRARHPGLVHAWLPPYGTSGEWSSLPPDDGLLSALTGVSWMQWSYGGTPVHLVTPEVTYGHAAIAANALAAALFDRRRSGAGRAVVVSGLHAFAAVQPAIRAAEMVKFEGRGSRGGTPHYQLYRCSDGLWLFLATLSQQFFLRALDALDLADLMTMEGVDGEFTNLLLPPMREQAIGRLDARFAERPRAEWLRILQENGVPCGPVGVREEWFAGETVAANNMRLQFDHPDLGPIAIPGTPVEFSETPGGVAGLIRDVEEAGLPSRGADPGERRLPAGLPLAGLRVLDVAAVIAGPFAPTILGSFGADVVKVEPLDGDFMRMYGLGFAAYNRGKRSLAVDLKRSEGLQAFYDLVRTSDVIVDNYRLGVRERLGIDYASLARVNPRIITVSVTGFGPRGPKAKDPGFDPLLQALSGLMQAQGGDDEPVFHQVNVNDNLSAMIAAFGALAALYAREETGRGQEVQTCLANQATFFQSGELTWYEGRPPYPRGGLDCVGVSALRRLYRCRDGEWLAVACATPGHATAVGEVLAAKAGLDKVLDAAALDEPRDGPLATRLASAFERVDRDIVLAALVSSGVPAAPARREDEVFDDPYLAENRVFESYNHPQFGPLDGLRAYADWPDSGAGPAFRRPAPLLGEQTRDLLAGLGYPPGRIEDLVRSGIVRETDPDSVKPAG